MESDGSASGSKRSRVDAGDSHDADGPRRKQPENPENNILLYTVYNAVHPITTEVLHAISSPSGSVLRMVIFRKTRVKALVEFDSVESAKRAKAVLSGADIYSGCCSLQVEYARTTKLNVHRNDAESWDYTCTGKEDVPWASRLPPLLREPSRGVHPQPYRPDGDPFDPPEVPSQTAKGAVMMAYGLDTTRVNCDRLFNLFCLYGNVARVKFLKTKLGTAMVQMGDATAVERCVRHLNHAPLFDPKTVLQLRHSKLSFLGDVNNPHALPDGTPSFKDFLGLNRFINPATSLNISIQSPSRILHFFSAPPNVTKDALVALFVDRQAPLPTAIKILPTKSEWSSAGLLEFEDTKSAIEAVLVLNHAVLDHPSSKFPSTVKLCFSCPREMNLNGSKSS